MKHQSLLLRTAGYATLALPSLLAAQQVAMNAPSASLLPANHSEPSAVVSAKQTTSTNTVPTWEKDLDRWLNLDTLNYSGRYRSVFDSGGARTFNQGQQRFIAHGEFKFDEAGKYGIGFHISSGRYFNWAYADFIGGGQHQFIANATAKMSPYEIYILNVIPFPQGFFNSGGGQLYFRQLYLDAQPVKGVDFQFGGLAINHGVNTEATSYDDDGYMSGERASLKRPENVWLNEVSYTRGFLGDLYTPNFFARGEHLSISNYWQILGRKDFGKMLSFSSDYTYTAPFSSIPPEAATYKLKTTREGIWVNAKKTKTFDSIRLEAYQRLNSGFYAPGYPFPHGKGYALTVSRAFGRRFDIDAGVANIDGDYGTALGPNPQAIILGLTTNGDQYGEGKRYFVRPTVPLNHWASLVGDYSHLYGGNSVAANGSIDIWNSQYLTAGVSFNLKKAFFSTDKVK